MSQPNTRPEEAGPLQFSEGIEDKLVDYVQGNAKDNDPESVLKAVDKFCWTTHWMMHVGDLKVAIVDQAVKQYLGGRDSPTILELGTYCAYSTVRMARLLPEKGKIFSIDLFPRNAARKMVLKAGVQNKVVFLSGAAETVIPTLQSKYHISSFDLVFIDHAKEAYCADLKIIEKYNLLHKGSVVIADNVVVFAINDYLDHVRNSGLYSSSVNHKGFLEYDNSGNPSHEVRLRGNIANII